MATIQTLLVQAQLLDSAGPDAAGGLRISPWAFLVLYVVGFMVAVFGHIVSSRPLVAFGIALIFAVTIFVPVLLAAAN